MKIREVVDFLEEKFPKELAFEGDNNGLLIGDESRDVSKVLICLDATIEVVNHAVNTGVNLIITHHPFIFTPLKEIDFKTPIGAKIEQLIKHDIALYSMHTNYDAGDGGMNDALLEKLDIPLIGKFGANDLGRLGALAEEMSLSELVKHLKAKLGVPTLSYTTAGNRPIKTVAIVGGSGGSQFEYVYEVGADAFISGDMKYNDLLEAKERGLHVIDVGHFVENIFVDEIEQLLAGVFGNKLSFAHCEVNDPIEFE